MRKIFLFWLLLSPFLCSCVGPADPGSGIGESSHRFTEAMRWRDFAGAALFLGPEVRGEFSTRFPRENADLQVVDSGIESIQVAADGNSAEADFVLEYYLLPSSRVKKWRWTQHWQMFREKIVSSGLWLITNAPPAFP